MPQNSDRSSLSGAQLSTLALEPYAGSTGAKFAPLTKDTPTSPRAALVIPPEKLAERDFWDEKLAQRAINLKDALLLTLGLGVPASQQVIDLCEAAFMMYQYGDSADLAVQFGCEISQSEKRDGAHDTARRNVKYHVQHFAAAGWPLLNPGNHPDKVSAFTKTADLLKNIKASTVFEIYYDRDLRKKKNHKKMC